MPLDEAFVVMSGFRNPLEAGEGTGWELPVQVLSGTAGSAKSEVPAAEAAGDPSHGIRADMRGAP
jgi:hypothetical protein